MAPTSKAKINMLHRSVFLLLPLFFVLHSLPVYSEDNLPNPPRTDDQLEEELKYLQGRDLCHHRFKDSRRYQENRLFHYRYH